jgi:hypothetical protein
MNSGYSAFVLVEIPSRIDCDFPIYLFKSLLNWKEIQHYILFYGFFIKIFNLLQLFNFLLSIANIIENHLLSKFKIIPNNQL